MPKIVKESPDGDYRTLEYGEFKWEYNRFLSRVVWMTWKGHGVPLFMCGREITWQERERYMQSEHG